jgi:ABC-type uncharacterized transport system substrate-binding protein
MRRREFLGALAGAASTVPTMARAQRERLRRIGILNTLPADDAHGHERVGVFLQELRQLGWIVGGNVRIDQRWWAGDDPEVMRKHATELVALGPDVLLATGGVAIRPLMSATRTVPIVFCNAPDPVGAGDVDSMARPGGNVTGFTQFEYSLSVKWLELLKQIAPAVTRVGVLRDPNTSSGIGQFGAIQGAAHSFGVELTPLGVGSAAEIERTVTAFAGSANSGLIVTSGQLNGHHRGLIAALAMRHKLPAAYPADFFASAGGLISYGPDRVDMFRRAASYVDRILKGEKPADLPVQAPTKYELVINLKTAKAIGLSIPPTLLGRADEVIE